MFQGAKNLDGAWTALGMDLIPPLATVNLTTPKAQASPPQAAGKLRGSEEDQDLCRGTSLCR